MSDPTLPNNLGVVEGFREIVAAYLRGLDSVFRGVAILTKRQGDVNQQIQEAFNGAGVFAEVSIVAVKMKTSNGKDILIERADFYVDIYENVPINQGDGGTKLGAWGLAENTLLHLNYETLPGAQYVIYASENGNTLEDVTKDPDSGDLVVRVRLTTKLQLPAPVTT